VSNHHVVVVGGGIAGLAAAHALLQRDHPPRVTLIEASDRLGGKLLSTPFAGLEAVDEGPDAFLARLPWATQLAKEVGFESQLTSPASGSASVWWHGFQPIPEGLLLGMPTDVWKLARTRLLSWPAKVRAAIEPLIPRTDLSDDSIGAFVRRRFGNQVHERLVDPLIGSIYAADTDHFSLTAVPQIAELAMNHRSILLAGRHRQPAPEGPVFYAPVQGMGSLVAATATALRDRGADLRTGATVESLEADGAGWRVDGVHADGVVLACPAAHAALLVADERLAVVPYADVAMVTLAVPVSSWPQSLLGRSGYLVPKPVQRLVTAVSFGSQKWVHWQTPESVILRISLGRDGLPVLHLHDDDLLAAAIDEVGGHLGIELQPTATRISRWFRAFPQYRPNHHLLVKQIESSLPPTITIAGASYHGIGIPACVRSGRAAADTLAQRLLDAPE
jgi:oxygen-dependent protoporphyrinogen oxidase